jgi:deazaflavin-dependent oxidoreductase (nitroreductase family)
MVDVQLPQWLARFNRHVTNPVQRLWAGWAPTMAVLEHVGRRSGKHYRTPLNVFSTDDGGIAVLLTYGPDRDWLKNLTAGGQGRMTRYGKTFTVTDPKTMPKAEAAPSVRGSWRPLFSMLPFEYAVLLKRIDA